MKKFSILLVAIIITVALHAQVLDPVKWNYTASKSSDKEYAVTIEATLSPAWHIYSIHTPGNGPVPTSISFNKNPLI